MSDDSSKLIDDAQPVAEALRIEQYLASISSEKFLALWLDPNTGMLEYEIDRLRAEVLIAMPDDVAVFAVFSMVDGPWSCLYGSDKTNHIALLAEFLALQSVAAQYSDHPARRLRRVAA